MLPLLLIAAAIGAIAITGGKPKSKKKNGSKPDPQPKPKPTSVGGWLATGGGGSDDTDSDIPTGTPGAYCAPPSGRKKGEFYSWSADGKSCNVWWNSDSRGIAISVMNRMWSELSESEKEKICKIGECEPDPFSMEPELFCEIKPNQDMNEFVKKVVLELYPQIPPDSYPLPEPDRLGRVNASNFVVNAWELVFNIFASELCGYNKIT